MGIHNSSISCYTYQSCSSRQKFNFNFKQMMQKSFLPTSLVVIQFMWLEKKTHADIECVPSDSVILS